VLSGDGEHVTPHHFPALKSNVENRGSAADLLHWTEGRALVATGSPFLRSSTKAKCTSWSGEQRLHFPRIGLGAIVSVAHEITDEMFLVAARALVNVSLTRLAEVLSIREEQTCARSRAKRNSGHP